LGKSKHVSSIFSGSLTKNFGNDLMMRPPRGGLNRSLIPVCLLGQPVFQHFAAYRSYVLGSGTRLRVRWGMRRVYMAPILVTAGVLLYGAVAAVGFVTGLSVRDAEDAASPA
jgi:hypothetical protein